MNGSDFSALGDPAAGDRARFRRLPCFGGVEVLDADFKSFTFAPHTHETPMIGVMVTGQKRFSCAQVDNLVGPGDLSLVNPGEVHTGGVVSGRLRYIGFYPTPELMHAAGLGETADFTAPAVRSSPDIHALLEALQPGQEPLTAAAGLIEALATIASRHGAAGPVRTPRPCKRAVAEARAMIEAGYQSPVSLEALAAAAGIGPRHLLRSFKADTGLTPQHYLRQTRVRAAAALLRRGEPLAGAAAAAGFADQPHMTRAFRALMGATPGAYRAAFAE